MLVVFAFNTFIVFVSTQTGLQMNKQKETQCKAFVRTKESIGAKIKNKFAYKYNQMMERPKDPNIVMVSIKY